jgi:large subunit ribosomal protein L4
VSGGGKKPFKQKGTGSARQGSSRAVQFVGGGIAHGPKPRDYSLELPKKMRKQALAESLSDKALQGNILIVEKLKFESPKTKQAISFLKSIGIEGKKSLIVLDHFDKSTFKSFRNISKTTVLFQNNLNTFEVMNHEVVVLTQETLKKMVETGETFAVSEIVKGGVK